MAESAPETHPPVIRFGLFEADLRTSELRKNGRRVKLDGQPFQILILLLQRPGDLVSRDELQQRLWPAGTYVDFERSINAAVKRLREALDESADTPRFIETLPRRGYRFIGPINGVAHVIEATTAPTTSTERAPWRLALRPSVPIVAVLAVVGLLLAPTLRDLFFGPRVTKVAVLPLKITSDDPAQRQFAEGLTEVLISELGNLDTLQVLPHRAAVANESRAEIARALGASGALEGLVTFEEDNVRVMLTFYQGAPESVVWSQQFVHPLSSPMALQSAIAREVASRLNIKLTGKDKTRLSRQASVNPRAYESFLAGRAYLRSGTDGFRKQAKAAFLEALDLDKTFTQPYAYLALLHCHGGQFLAGGPKESRQEARRYAAQAIDAGEGLSEAYSALAWTSMVDWDWRQADEHFQRAIRENPDFATARVWYAQYLAAVERVADARFQAATAMDVEPGVPGIATHAAEAYLRAGDIHRATRIWRDIIARDPGYWGARYFLAQAYLMLGKPEDAIRELDLARQLRGDLPTAVDYLTVLAAAYAGLGRRQEALEIMDGLELRSMKDASMRGLWMASAYVALDDQAKAEEWLRRAYDRKDAGVFALKVAPAFAAVRNTPWFHQLIADMGFPSSTALAVPHAPARPTAK